MSREETFHRLFPELPESEVVIEDFRCALMQKYRCDRTKPCPSSIALLGMGAKAACGWVLMCCRVAGVHRCDANDLTPEIPISCDSTANPSSAAVRLCSR